MKKLFMLVLTFVFALVLNGCGGVETKTCSMKHEGYTETYVFTANDDKIEKVELTIAYENSMFGVETLSTLTDDQKEQIRKNMIATLGLEDKEYEGLEIMVDIKDSMTVTVKADYSKADASVLSKVGLDYSNTDMSLDSASAAYEANGGTCK